MQLINVANELEGYRQDRAMKQAETIYGIVQNILNISKEQNIPTHAASNKRAEERLSRIGGISKIYSGTNSNKYNELMRR